MESNKKKSLIWLVLLLCCGTSVAEEDDNWRVAVAEDPISRKNTCLLMAKEQTIQDGQSTTPVRIIYNGEVFIAVTESHIDLTYPGVGLSVDDQHTFKIDRLARRTLAVFESDVPGLREAFIKGIKGRLALGFWPTWPKGDTIVMDFSLIGFTKAEQAFQACRESGKT